MFLVWQRPQKNQIKNHPFTFSETSRNHDEVWDFFSSHEILTGKVKGRRIYGEFLALRYPQRHNPIIVSITRPPAPEGDQEVRKLCTIFDKHAHFARLFWNSSNPFLEKWNFIVYHLEHLWDKDISKLKQATTCNNVF